MAAGWWGSIPSSISSVSSLGISAGAAGDLQPTGRVPLPIPPAPVRWRARIARRACCVTARPSLRSASTSSVVRSWYTPGSIDVAHRSMAVAICCTAASVPAAASKITPASTLWPNPFCVKFAELTTPNLLPSFRMRCMVLGWKSDPAKLSTTVNEVLSAAPSNGNSKVSSSVVRGLPALDPMTRRRTPPAAIMPCNMCMNGRRAVPSKNPN